MASCCYGASFFYLHLVRVFQSCIGGAISFIDMNDTCQGPCRGEVESPARRQGSSTVGTLIFAGWLPHFVPPSRGCLGLCTCVRTILPCTNERRGFPIPDSCAFRPDLQPCSLNSNSLRQLLLWDSVIQEWRFPSVSPPHIQSPI